MDSFWLGFEKQASFSRMAWNKLKGLFTGKEYFYHGTSAKRAKKIMKEGLKPGVKGGISDVDKLHEEAPGHKDSVSLTKLRDYAWAYGKQQGKRDKSKGVVLEVALPKEKWKKKRVDHPYLIHLERNKGKDMAKVREDGKSFDWFEAAHKGPVSKKNIKRSDW